MGLFDIFGKKDVEGITKGVPFTIKTRLSPVRLAAHKNDKCDLIISLKNNEDETVLTSVVIEVPKAIGMDSTTIQKAKEIRIGYLGKKETKDLTVPVWSSSSTLPGNYTVTVKAYVHYRTYAYVLNSVKKSVDIRVV